MNARRAPEGIGESHGADELGDLRIDGRTTGSTASRLPVPERAEALPVPANHGLRLNDMERFAPLGLHRFGGHRGYAATARERQSASVSFGLRKSLRE